MVSFDGIFTNIYKVCNNNLSLIKHHISVEADTLEGRGSPWTVLDPSFAGTADKSNWISKNKPNQTFTVTFLDRAVLLSSYSIKSRLDVNAHHPLEWNFEASNNNHSWHLIHHKPRNNELRGIARSMNYNYPQKDAFKMFRLSMIGTNSDGGNYLSFNKLELFGKVYVNKITSKGYRSMKMFYMILKISRLIQFTA